MEDLPVGVVVNDLPTIQDCDRIKNRIENLKASLTHVTERALENPTPERRQTVAYVVNTSPGMALLRAVVAVSDTPTPAGGG